MLRLALVLALCLVALPAFAQTDPRSPHPNTPPDEIVPRSGGPQQTTRVVGRVQVGEKAPEFDLDAAGGARFHLKQMRGAWLALFFTDRREDLPRLESYARTLDSLQFRTVVVCNEHVQVLTAWRGTRTTRVTPVADDRGEIAAIYGLWDAEHGATRPGLFLIDPQGVVKLALLGQHVGAPSLPGLVQTAVSGL